MVLVTHGHGANACVEACDSEYNGMVVYNIEYCAMTVFKKEERLILQGDIATSEHIGLGKA